MNHNQYPLLAVAGSPERFACRLIYSAEELNRFVMEYHDRVSYFIWSKYPWPGISWG